MYKLVTSFVWALLFVLPGCSSDSTPSEPESRSEELSTAEKANARAFLIFSAEPTDEGLEKIGRLSDVTDLNLGYSEISDRGLIYLIGLTELTHLKLYQTSVSDAGLEHLRSLNSLKSLDLRNTNVSAQGVAELRQALPQVSIVY